MPLLKHHLSYPVKGGPLPIRLKRGYTRGMSVPPFHERIRIARKRAKLTLEQVGDAFDVSPQAVSQWEKGTSEIQRDKAFALPRILQCNPMWLFYGVGSPEPLAQNPALSGQPPAATTLGVGQHLVVGGRTVPHIPAADAALDYKAAVTAADAFMVVHFDASTEAFSLDVWNARNAPDFDLGHRVVVDPRVTPDPGDFVFAAIGQDGSPILGQLRVERANGGSKQVLLAVNSMWPEHEIGPDDRIIGTVVEHVRPRRAR